MRRTRKKPGAKTRTDIGDKHSEGCGGASEREPFLLSRRVPCLVPGGIMYTIIPPIIPRKIVYICDWIYAAHDGNMDTTKGEHP